MMREIGISVITPVYNRQDCIGRCIESVVDQHYPNIEFWIVDDGSTDATSSVIDKYARQYPFINVCRFEKNRGVNAARNYAIQNSSKDFILFLDSDDYFAENALHTIDRTISAHPEYRHYLFAQDDRMSYYEQNPLLLGENTEFTFADFLTGKVSGDFLHVISASLLQMFPFDEYLRIYEGLTFLSIYKEGQKQYFTKQILVKRERGRSDSVTTEYLLYKTGAIRKQIQALRETLLLFEADYKRFDAVKELQSLKRRISILETVLKFGFLLKPIIFVYSCVKQFKLCLNNKT
ncbi:MAG: glycosyltransferase family 2 protein [Dysgonamonadaceae bacterium]|jgi:glycosyltransferase involved in cell wall biosynthesis|nr:glycosyltransferase family 2 protein [Dysgonamonadaceae bacterium]